MWILAYLFLGFLSVYRVVVFSDISSKAGLPALAVFGLMFGRLGLRDAVRQHICRYAIDCGFRRSVHACNRAFFIAISRSV